MIVCNHMSQIFIDFSIVDPEIGTPTSAVVDRPVVSPGIEKDQRDIWTDGYLAGVRTSRMQVDADPDPSRQITSAYDLEQRMSVAQSAASLAIAELLVRAITIGSLEDFTNKTAASIEYLVSRIKSGIIAGTEILIRNDHRIDISVHNISDINRSLASGEMIISWPYGQAIVNIDTILPDLTQIISSLWTGILSSNSLEQ